MLTDDTGMVVFLPTLGRKPPEPIDCDKTLRCLAFQAVALPNTLSKSEIEQLGLALLTRFQRSLDQPQ